MRAAACPRDRVAKPSHTYVAVAVAPGRASPSLAWHGMDEIHGMVHALLLPDRLRCSAFSPGPWLSGFGALLGFIKKR
jgi:hypothetical protein